MQYPVTKDSMNYAVVIVGSIGTLATVYWIVSARHWFVGPKRTKKEPLQLPPVGATNHPSKKAMARSNDIRNQL